MRVVVRQSTLDGCWALMASGNGGHGVALRGGAVGVKAKALGRADDCHGDVNEDCHVEGSNGSWGGRGGGRHSFRVAVGRTGGFVGY